MAATWFDVWDRNIFLNRPAHFDLQVNVELRGTVTGQVSFQSGLYIKPSNSSISVYQVSVFESEGETFLRCLNSFSERTVQ